MGKLSELEMLISDLRNAATMISEAATTLLEMFGGAKAEEEAMPAEEKPQLTLEQVRAVLSDLSRKGFTADVRKLLKKHGAEKLSLIDPSHYEALLAEAAKLKNPEEDTDGA